MSWLSNITNGINSAIDTAQNVVETAVDAAQSAVQSANDAIQTAANSAVDKVQDGIVDIANIYDSVLGVNVFGAAAQSMNDVIEIQQNVSNQLFDILQTGADVAVDQTQALAREMGDVLQYAGTILPKMLDDAIGDASINQPPKPAIVQTLEDRITGR